jgi:histidinol-phosphate aminotransferase
MERRTFLRTGFAAGVASVAPVPLQGMSWIFDPRHAQTGTIRLSSNENPLGLAPVAREAVLEGREEANRYPGASRRALINVLAPYLDVPEERLFFGAGSTEILRVAVQAWSAPNARLVLATPTFEDVPGYSRPFPYQVDAVPLTADYAHDLGRMREIVDSSAHPAIVYICNPNNPTGTLTPSAEVDAWIKESSDRTLFLVDEAYLEYADDPGYWSAQPWTADRTNVIVVRTFSKIYAMAGMRIGYGIAHPKTVRRMGPFLTRNNPNHMASVAALASLEDSELVGRSVDVNSRARAILHECLDDLGLEYLPTHTNFLMHRISGELRTYIERMAEAGIRVGRPFPPMLEYNRLSFGLPEEMERFAETLRGFRGRGWV